MPVVVSTRSLLMSRQWALGGRWRCRLALGYPSQAVSHVTCLWGTILCRQAEPEVWAVCPLTRGQPLTNWPTTFQNWIPIHEIRFHSGENSIGAKLGSRKLIKVLQRQNLNLCRFQGLGNLQAKGAVCQGQGRQVSVRGRDSRFQSGSGTAGFSQGQGQQLSVNLLSST